MTNKLSDDEIRIRRKLRDDFIHYASKCLRIRTKDAKIDPFTLNKAQLYTHSKLQYQKGQTGKVRALILKGLQQGMSTLIGGRFYHLVTHSFGMQAFILTHQMEATANLYKMAKRYYENTPDLVKPSIKTSNSKELLFGELDSGYKVGTAENANVGRSNTIQLLHGSEVAFWSNTEEHAKGILQTVPDMPNTEVILESTANGVGNYFHQQWQMAEAGTSEYIAIFVPWYWQDEYQQACSPDFELLDDEEALVHQYGLTKEQLAWRRKKIIELSVNGMDGQKAFKQEYPCNSTEAFQLTGEDSYIDSELVMKARKCQELERIGPLLLGIDPARFGDDRSSIIRRRGRVAYGLESYTKKDTMEITGLVHRIIQSENPFRVLVDVGGLGAGVVDRLKELGHAERVVAVNAGSKPLDANKYTNKRAEMWGELKAWLVDEPCQIPDSDSLHADLCGLKYKFDSNSRLKMESKDEAKKRGVRSPDEADSLCLTFAIPNTHKTIESKSKQDAVVDSLAHHFNQQSYARTR